MGDIKRAAIFADFIERNYPPDRFRRVLDVAGGAGYVSVELTKRGYDCVIVDPRRTAPAKRDRSMLGRIERRLELFEAEMAKDADLVVAMHPDGATEAATRACVYAPALIVPCCNYWDGHEGPIEGAVRNTMMKLANCWEAELPMKGKRLVLVGSR